MTLKTLIKLIPIYIGTIGLFVYFVQTQHIGAISAASITKEQVQDNIIRIRAQAPDSNNAPQQVTFGIPRELFIPRFGSVIPLIAGEYFSEAGIWNVSNTHAHFATVSALPNDSTGNTIIYGHNSKDIFSALFSLKIGDVVEVRTSENLTFVYKMRQSDRVTPKDVSVLDTTTSPQLTLLTCEGLWNEYRRLVYFDLFEVRAEL